MAFVGCADFGAELIAAGDAVGQAEQVYANLGAVLRAAGAEPVPPGPGNPLGTRWMGLSEPLIGNHGTPDAASIGYSASHGCIRMHVSDVIRLYKRVPIGTPVLIA